MPKTIKSGPQIQTYVKFVIMREFVTVHTHEHIKKNPQTQEHKIY